MKKYTRLAVLTLLLLGAAQPLAAAANGKEASQVSQVQLEQDVKTAEAAVKAAQAEVDKATNKVNQATAPYQAAKERLERAQRKVNAINQMVLSDEYIASLKQHHTSKATDQEAKDHLTETSAAERATNQFKGNSDDQAVAVNPTQLTNDQKNELAHFAADVINQVRSQMGTQAVTVSTGAQNLATTVQSSSQTKEQIAANLGLNSGEGEQAYADLSATSASYATMNDLKAGLYEAILSFLVTGDTWNDAISLIGLNTNSPAYLGLAVSSTGFRLVLVPQANIGQNSTFDQTAIANPHTREAILAEAEQAAAALQMAQVAHEIATAQLQEAKQALATAQNQLKQAQAALAKAQAAAKPPVTKPSGNKKPAKTPTKPSSSVKPTPPSTKPSSSKPAKPKTGTSPAATVVPVYRLYHPGLKVHLYTKDSNEKNVLSKRGWQYEGVSWKTETTKGKPVYRLYHPGLKVHLYTIDANEYKVLAGRGWKQEGIAYRSYGDVKVYRLYHPGLKKHLYTKDANEYKVLANRGWKQEGIAWYSR